LPIKLFSIWSGGPHSGRQPGPPCYSTVFFYDILALPQIMQGETAMAKDKDKGKEKSNKPKLSIKEKKLKKKEKLSKKAAMA
jgi:hypothetical protein